MNESQARDAIVAFGKSMFDRGLSFGSTGNISQRVEDGWLLTPTGASLGALDPARLSKIDDTGRHISGDPPTKEQFLHVAVYDQRPRTEAVVHLHSTHSVAISCLKDVNTNDALPPLTAYYVMRIGALPIIPYFPPGDINLAKAVREMASRHHAVLLANHGPVVAGASLQDAVYATEELEETAKLFLMLRERPIQPLSPEQVAELRRRFPVQC